MVSVGVAEFIRRFDYVKEYPHTQLPYQKQGAKFYEACQLFEAYLNELGLLANGKSLPYQPVANTEDLDG